MYRALQVCAVLALAIVSSSLNAATRVVINGRVIDTANIESPQFPSSREECAQFRAEVSELLDQVNAEHEVCLAQKSIPNGSAGTCSKSGCQSLHNAREELSSALSKGYSACNSAVNERQSSERWGNSTYGTDLEAFKSALRVGPISAVRSLVKQKIGDVIDNTFGFASPVVKSGFNASLAAQRMASTFIQLQAACKEKSTQALNACNKEMLGAIERLPRLVPAKYSADPGISLIQRAMMSRLNLMMRDTLDRVDHIGEQIDEIADERPAPSRRRRTTPRIENN